MSRGGRVWGGKPRVLSRAAGVRGLLKVGFDFCSAWGDPGGFNREGGITEFPKLGMQKG